MGLRAGGHQQLDVRHQIQPGGGLAVGPDEPRPRPAARLEPDRRRLAGAGRGARPSPPPVLDVEEVDGRGLLGVEAVQLEAAVAGVDEAVFLPPEVDRVDLLPGEDHRVLDRLAPRADHVAAQRPAGSEGRVDLVGRLAGLHLVMDDGVGVEAGAAAPAPAEERPAADLLGDVVERRPHDHQDALAGRDGEPE